MPKTSKNKISAGSAGRTLAVLHFTGTFAMVPFARRIQNKFELSQTCKSNCLDLIIGVLVVSAIFYYRMVSGRMPRSRVFFHALTVSAIGFVILRMRLLDVEYFHIVSYAALAVWLYLWFEPSSAARSVTTNRAHAPSRAMDGSVGHCKCPVRRGAWGMGGPHAELGAHCEMPRMAFRSQTLRNALLGATCVSGLDEFLQYLTPGRFCDIRDFSINFLGAVLGLLFILPLRTYSNSTCPIPAPSI